MTLEIIIRDRGQEVIKMTECALCEEPLDGQQGFADHAPNCEAVDAVNRELERRIEERYSPEGSW